MSSNFYVIQLSIVNSGPKKVAVPLSAIQAEIEWDVRKNKSESGSAPASGSKQSGQPGNASVANSANNSTNSNGPETEKQYNRALYLQGPPTISPIPLQAVSGYFDTYAKSFGKRALLFNTLGGIGLFATGLVPIFGPSYPMGVNIFSNAFVPALRTTIGDLSSQQLQNLTGLSWESVEVLPSGGGSVNKFIYIQRGEQDSLPPKLRIFSGGRGEKNRPNQIIKKRIVNILGLEITGFEVADAEAKQATRQ